MSEPSATERRQPSSASGAWSTGPLESLTATPRSFATTRGAVLAGAPVPWLLQLWLMPGHVEPRVIASLASVCLGASALSLATHVHRGRWLATMGVLLTLRPLATKLLDSPGVVFGAALAAASILASLWASDERWLSRRHEDAKALAARGASATALLMLGAALTAGRADETLTYMLIGASHLCSAALIARWIVACGGLHATRAAIVLGAFTLGVMGVVASWGQPRYGLLAAAVPVATALLTLPGRSEPAWTLGGFWEPVLTHPARLIVITFAGLSGAGTLLLALPACTRNAQSIGFVDAAFTAISAACVTGLVVRDTATVFNGLGQLVILLLIQIGGLGIMTFSTAAMRVFKLRLSLRHETTVARLLNAEDRGQLYAAARRLFTFTFAAEAAGTLALGLLFWDAGMSIGQALWTGVFTAVSAFCNAGFALFSENLIPFQRNPAVLHVVATLVIFGGLSPLAVLSLPAILRGRSKRVRSQHRIALYATGVLLALGFVMTLTMEWNHALRHLPVADRLHNAWFHSVTLRTAGFNAIEMTDLRPPTSAIMLVWMVIGGSPGGTAGGLKTTTLALLGLAAVAAVRGHSQIVIFSRQISHPTVYKAAAIAVAGLGAAFLGVLSLLLTQSIAPEAAVFEAISALGTVGLTLGATQQLDGIGKAIVMMLMFAGRVGPLTLFMFLTQRTSSAVWKYPVEEIEVG